MALADTHCASVVPGAAVEPATRGTADRTSGERVARLSSTLCRGAAGLPRLFAGTAELRRRRTVVNGDLLSIDSIAYVSPGCPMASYRIVVLQAKRTGGDDEMIDSILP